MEFLYGILSAGLVVAISAAVNKLFNWRKERIARQKEEAEMKKIEAETRNITFTQDLAKAQEARTLMESFGNIAGNMTGLLDTVAKQAVMIKEQAEDLQKVMGESADLRRAVQECFDREKQTKKEVVGDQILIKMELAKMTEAVAELDKKIESREQDK